MNRLLFCIILLLSGQTVFAEKLYRWVESDGSITFSPTPPPAGTDYKAVNAAHNNAAKADLPLPKADLPKPQADLTAPDQKRSILATSEHGLDAPQPENKATEIMALPDPEVELQKLSYAPDTGSKGKTPAKATAVEPEADQTGVSQTESIANSQKRRQCQDLSKRVMSLERRLRSPLKPVDMDNTVVAMARYQRSYDQHCVE